MTAQVESYYFYLRTCDLNIHHYLWSIHNSFVYRFERIATKSVIVFVFLFKNVSVDKNQKA